jgi:hypothetical protein
MLRQLRLVLMLVAVGCASRMPAQPRQACHVAPLTPCTSGTGSGDLVRGHAIHTILCSEHQSGTCSASYAVFDDKSLGNVTLRGHELGCTGPRDSLCCPIDALHREVAAYGTLDHDASHQWIDVTQICAP